jgi:NADPH:quinone reductase-like Zn-dependent oxidoreductase
MAALTNRAVWQDACGVPSVVRSSSLPTNDKLGRHKVLVKVHAWDINPYDQMIQDRDMAKYPVIWAALFPVPSRL